MNREKINTESEPAENHSEWDILTELSDETEKILNGEIAQNILPYLSLDKLSDKEKTDILKFSEDTISKSLQNQTEKPFLNDPTYGLAHITGDFEEYKENGLISAKLQEANKLFCASILEHTNIANDEDFTWEIYHNFFSFSPNAFSYCGELTDSLELFNIAERLPSKNNPLTKNLVGEIVLEASFANHNNFKETLQNLTPEKQLKFIPIIYLFSQYCWPDDYSDGALKKIHQTFDSLSEEGETPLIRTISESLNEKINQRLYEESNLEWVEIDPNNPEHADILEKHEQKQKRIQESQNHLHETFSNLPKNQFIVKISPDIAASLTSNNNFSFFSDEKNHQTSLLNTNSKNDLNLSQKNLTHLSLAHNPDIKPTIDKKLNLDLSELTLNSQTHLLNFMAEADNGRFDNLCKTLGKIDNENLRKKLLSGFVAADFGPDFGDSLLDIANSEHINHEQFEEILDQINSCRESIHSITNLYQDFDNGNFASEYSRAANERLTDVLATFRMIANEGNASAELSWLGNANFDYSQALEALNYETKSLEIISGTLNDVTENTENSFAEVILPSKNSKFYNFYSPNHGYVLLYTRPKGSFHFDQSYEYANKTSGVEASISLIVNPKDPFSLPNPFRPNKNSNTYDPSTMDKVSAIRIDREGRTPGTPANDPNRNPLNPTGTISVDLAAIGDRADTPSGKISRLISIGNKLRSNNESDFTLNHNTNWFNQSKYGTDTGFEALVNYVDSLVESQCKTSAPKPNQDSFTKHFKEMNVTRKVA